MWLTVGVTLTRTSARSAPELALQWWPWGAAPRVSLAARITAKQDSSAAELARAARLAREALAREPINVEAASTLATIRARQGDIPAADRLFLYSEKLSRRDLVTQLWMIERAVRQDDIPGALRHYNRALTTSRTAPDLLMPTLVAAADDPKIAKSLSKQLARRPIWANHFMLLALKEVKDSRALVIFGRSLRFSLDDRQDAAFASAILARLVKDGYYSEGLAYYTYLTDTGAKGGTLRDGDFASATALLPFDWWLRESVDLSAAKEVGDEGNMRLALRSAGGASGEVARQLIVLGPGRYVLSGTVGSTGEGRLNQPGIRVACVDGPPLLNQAFPSTADISTFRFEFVVPANCAAQWLGIRTALAEKTDAWIDDLKIVPATR